MIQAEPGAFTDAIQAFWTGRQEQQIKQAEAGKPDAGSRGAATGGRQFKVVESLLREYLRREGIDENAIRLGPVLSCLVTTGPRRSGTFW